MWRPAAFLALLAAPAAAENIVSARYDAPTTRYAHGVLGDAVEWGALVMTGRSGQVFRLTLPASRVFEDT
ncbi:MAG: VCBS repeat-containing protein, partial [Silicimonas sp.]|nr:VCBS repeat-containing protein [Silicimonas sp.]